MAMEKNEKEKQMLYEWGKKNQSKYSFQKIDKEIDSYFIKRKTDFREVPYIKEYGFETVLELDKELESLWYMDEVLGEMRKVIGVAAIKNKPLVATKESETKKTEIQNQLPTFIYNF